MKRITSTTTAGYIKTSRSLGMLGACLTSFLPFGHTKSRESVKIQPRFRAPVGAVGASPSFHMLIGSDLGANGYSYLSEA